MEECYFYKSYRLKACKFNKSSTPTWMFFTFIKLYKWYQMAKSIHYKRVFYKTKFLFFPNNFHFIVVIINDC